MRITDRAVFALNDLSAAESDAIRQVVEELPALARGPRHDPRLRKLPSFEDVYIIRATPEFRLFARLTAVGTVEVLDLAAAELLERGFGVADPFGGEQ